MENNEICGLISNAVLFHANEISTPDGYKMLLTSAGEENALGVKRSNLRPHLDYSDCIG